MSVFLATILTVQGQPTISTQPVDKSVVVGATATFNVRATGALSYQWYLNGAPINNATASAYTTPRTQDSDDGSQFYVVVSNAGGPTFSDTAQLNVLDPPIITTQPADETIYGGSAGGVGYLYVVAEGSDPLTYQWRLGGSAIPGATDLDYYTTTPGTYSVVIQNGAGKITSSNAVLTVLYPPQIITEPQDLNINVGQTANLIVTATGTAPLYYQWFHDGSPIAGATANGYSIRNATLADAGDYYAQVSNSVDQVPTDPIILSVDVPPRIISGPLSVTNNPGEDVTFTVQINDGEATFPVSYQWRFNGQPIDGQIDSTLYIYDVDSTAIGSYTCLITNDGGYVISAPATLSLRTPPTITIPPVNARVGAGTNVAFTARAAGTPPLSYQWLFNGNPIAHATNTIYSLRPNNTNQSGLYTIMVSNIVTASNQIYATADATLTVIAETTPPTVTITNPSSNTASTTNSAFTFRGRATDNAIITTVAYQLNSSSFQPTTGTTSWSADVTLQPGTNLFAIQATDNSGNVSKPTTRTLFYSVIQPLTLITNGVGTITGITNMNLEIGRGYKVTATAGTGKMFAGWSGSVTSTTPSLTFIMQTNLTLQANFVDDPYLLHKGTYSGLFYDTNGVQVASSGSFTLTVAPRGVSSGKLLEGTNSYSFTNSFTSDGASQFQVTRAKKTALLVSLAIDLTNGTDLITGTVSDTNWTSVLLGDRNIFSATNPSPFISTNTFAIFGDTTVGNGYATLTFDRLGNGRLTGVLADGTSISESATISKNGDWPLYVAPYGGSGTVISWLNYANSNITGTVSWIRPTMTKSRLYTSGFTNLTTAVGGAYLKPASGVRALNLTNAVVLLSGGSLNGVSSNAVTYAANNAVTVAIRTNKLTISVNAANGTVSGTFFNPTTHQTNSIRGILLQQQNIALGYFLSTNVSGQFILQGADLLP